MSKDILDRIFMEALKCAVTGDDPRESGRKLAEEIKTEQGEKKQLEENVLKGKVLIKVEKAYGNVPTSVRMEGKSIDITVTFAYLIGRFALDVSEDKDAAKKLVEMICGESKRRIDDEVKDE